MKIIVNGQPREIPAALTVAGLLEELQVDEKQVVVERNAAILAKPSYAEEQLAANDVLEIVQFVGGG